MTDDTTQSPKPETKPRMDPASPYTAHLITPLPDTWTRRIASPEELKALIDRAERKNRNTEPPLRRAWYES